MIQSARAIARRLAGPRNSRDPLVILPKPNLKKLRASGSASIDLRLGCWFVTFRQTRVAVFDVYDEREDIPSEFKLTKLHYVPFGEAFILQPRSFVLGTTLEWIRLQKDLAGYVVGRSSWGRHGLIIATATGVHPGFTGCLTLELTNVGEIPITIKPGTRICQLFLHKVESTSKRSDQSRFIGRRRPTLCAIELDEIARKLGKPLHK